MLGADESQKIILAGFPRLASRWRQSFDSGFGGRGRLPKKKMGQDVSAAHIRNTPNRVSGTGALSAAENASASTRRVSDGAMMPSSQSRAVA